MVTLGVKWTTKSNQFPTLKKEFGVMSGKSVEVGVFNGEHAWLAGIHEYGCTIHVTNKQRRYMAKNYGIILGKTINIPERSFLRTGYDENRDEIAKKATRLMAEVAGGRMSSDGCMKAVGLELSSKIKDYARDLSDPPNKPFTIEQKGSSNPLVDTGDMIEGITWRAGK